MGLINNCLFKWYYRTVPRAIRMSRPPCKRFLASIAIVNVKATPMNHSTPEAHLIGFHNLEMAS